MADREGNDPVKCGYGLLGLCCDSCLCGPCRRSPFDDTVSGGFCREDSDWMVAHNIMERVTLESLQDMAAFKDALERVSDPVGPIDAARLKEMRLFLSLLSRRPNPLMEALYPEQPFPTLYALRFPVGSWMTTLLDAMSERPNARRGPEAILTNALRLSAMALAAEALAQELAGAAHEEIDVDLPGTPSPFLLLISDEDGHQDNGREAQETLMNEIDAACRKEARIYRLPHAALLPSFARHVYAKWGIPVSMTRSVAVIFSSSMTRGLGALALGFSLVPLPGYPIQGSPLVEKYLTQGLKSKFGHAYLRIPPREDLCEAIIRSLSS